MSAFLDLRDAVVAALSEAPALAGGFIKPGRGFSLPAEKQQGIFVRLVRGNGEQPFAGDNRTDWQTAVIVVCLARAAAGVDADTAVDPLLMAAWARLASATPPASSDGWTVQPIVDWDIEEADQTVGAAALRLLVNHRTASGALSAAA